MCPRFTVLLYIMDINTLLYIYIYIVSWIDRPLLMTVRCIALITIPRRSLNTASRKQCIYCSLRTSKIAAVFDRTLFFDFFDNGRYTIYHPPWLSSPPPEYNCIVIINRPITIIRPMSTHTYAILLFYACSNITINDDRIFSTSSFACIFPG